MLKYPCITHCQKGLSLYSRIWKVPHSARCYSGVMPPSRLVCLVFSHQSQKNVAHLKYLVCLVFQCLDVEVDVFLSRFISLFRFICEYNTIFWEVCCPLFAFLLDCVCCCGCGWWRFNFFFVFKIVLRQYPILCRKCYWIPLIGWLIILVG